MDVTASPSPTLRRTRSISSRTVAVTPSMSKQPWMSPVPGCTATGTDVARRASAALDEGLAASAEISNARAALNG
jgi:hypothetical protein